MQRWRWWMTWWRHDVTVMWWRHGDVMRSWHHDDVIDDIIHHCHRRTAALKGAPYILLASQNINIKYTMYVTFPCKYWQWPVLLEHTALNIERKKETWWKLRSPVLCTGLIKHHYWYISPYENLHSVISENCCRMVLPTYINPTLISQPVIEHLTLILSNCNIQR